MKRIHMHVTVEDLGRSIHFYSALFGAEPAVVKPDYAKWMLEDPRVNFAISTGAMSPGPDHFGIQVETSGELEGLHQRMVQMGLQPVPEPGVTCCYAVSDKHWVRDPQGVSWEVYLTHGAADERRGSEPAAAACCSDTTAAQPACCGSAGP
jgi:predicted enzyme related to lactoylglutathione lyase